MKTFSFRRMLLFSRLQLCEIYGRNTKKIFSISLWMTATLCVLALLINGGRPGDSAGTTEEMTFVTAVVFSMLFYADLVGQRLMVPASAAEKFGAFFLNSLVVMIIAVAMTATAGSAIISIVSLFSDSPDSGPVILFFRKGFDWHALVNLLIVPLFTWLTMFGAVRKKFGTGVFWSVLAGYFILLFIPGILRQAGILERETARILSACITTVLVIVSLIWSYRLLKKAELNSRDND